MDNVANRKRRRRGFRQSRKELRCRRRASGTAWSTLPDGAVDFVNASWVGSTGLSQKYALGWNWEAATNPDDRSRVVAEWRESLKNGR
jgi:hypothetical protein